MLKDPNFNIADLTLRSFDKGVAFSEFYMTSPMDGRELPTVVGATIPGHKQWERVKEPMKSTRLMLSAKHSTGIYMGFQLDHTIEMLSPTKMIDSFPLFDLSSGLWYSTEEFHEGFGLDLDEKFLESGKPRMNNNSYADSYGLADNLTQVLKAYRNVVTHPDYNVVMHIHWHDKKSLAGMRWHKQGKYLGNFKKKHEYIDDEVGLEHILSFHLYVIE